MVIKEKLSRFQVLHQLPPSIQPPKDHGNPS
jgi:hypothetical protein